MFNFWFSLPPVLRAIMGIVLIIIAVIIFFASGGVVAIGFAVVGLIFLLFCNAGNDVSGYNF